MVDLVALMTGPSNWWFLKQGIFSFDLSSVDIFTEVDRVVLTPVAAEVWATVAMSLFHKLAISLFNLLGGWESSPILVIGRQGNLHGSCNGVERVRSSWLSSHCNLLQGLVWYSVWLLLVGFLVGLGGFDDGRGLMWCLEYFFLVLDLWQGYSSDVQYTALSTVISGGVESDVVFTEP
jgi:hypothetical protein